jgi:hypothetical protein
VRARRSVSARAPRDAHAVCREIRDHRPILGVGQISLVHLSGLEDGLERIAVPARCRGIDPPTAGLVPPADPAGHPAARSYAASFWKDGGLVDAPDARIVRKKGKYPLRAAYRQSTGRTELVARYWQ